MDSGVDSLIIDFWKYAFIYHDIMVVCIKPVVLRYKCSASHCHYFFCRINGGKKLSVEVAFSFEFFF